MEEAPVVMVEVERVMVADDPTMVTEVEEAQEDIAKEEVAEAKNANLFQANPVKKFPSNHVTQYLAKFQNKTANKFLDNPANPFLVNNANLYLAKNADLFHLKNAKASQLRCAVEGAALVVMEDQVVDVDIRAEEDMVITAKKRHKLQLHIAIDKV